MRAIFVLLLLLISIECQASYGWLIRVKAESVWPNVILDSSRDFEFWTCKDGGTGAWIDSSDEYDPRISIDILSVNLPPNVTNWKLNVSINFPSSEILYGKREAIYFLEYNRL